MEEIYTAAVITVSDRSYKGKREDKGGPLVAKMLENDGYNVVLTEIVPDEKEKISEAIIKAAAKNIALIVTTGGTGFAPRDVTPEATLAVADRNAPGIAEAIRAYSLTITPRAMLSRGASVIRKQTLIVNLPGSPKAVEESLTYILDSLSHGLDILLGTAFECARK